ncbi:hypothetical protein TIFTF001_012168 [Ficus carica]|uniref:Uncharacterized protein n=1 Tax=Ficus carica TaxID=3494 RepID=A0AA87ZZL0_FICCA|nr:hypothetical protein TIFTF001_012168 [Ficus carica]
MWSLRGLNLSRIKSNNWRKGLSPRRMRSVERQLRPPLKLILPLLISLIIGMRLYVNYLPLRTARDQIVDKFYKKRLGYNTDFLDEESKEEDDGKDAGDGNDDVVMGEKFKASSPDIIFY